MRWSRRARCVSTDIEAINERHTRLIAGEVARQHAAWFRDYAALYRPRTAELIT